MAIDNINYQYLKDILEQMRQGNKIGNVRINELGGRFGGKTYAMLDFAVLIPLILPKGLKCQVIGVRNMVESSQELWDDMVEHAQEIYGDSWAKVRINNTKKKLIINGQEIRVMGLKSNKKGRIVKTGLKRAKQGAYVIIFIDEAWEVEKNDYQALLEATLDAKSTIVIRTGNPFSRANYWVDYCCKNLRHSERMLSNEKTGGQQFKIIKSTEKINNELVTTTNIFHYTNWRTNKDNLSGVTIQTIKDTWKIDPFRARVVDYGMPMITNGAIYARLMDKINRLTEVERPWFTDYYIGIDFGHVDATSAIFIAYSSNLKYQAILDEYYHSNLDAKSQYKDPRQTAIDIIKKIKQFIIDTPDIQRTGIDVYVDNSAIAYMLILKEEALKQGIINLVSIRGSTKPLILERVDSELLIMGQSRLFVDYDRVKKLLWEMELSQWDEDKTKLTRLDVNDHALNAWEYAMSKNLYRQIKDYTNIIMGKNYGNI
jgi:PBSX family phage terminase large subunit